MSNDKSGRNKLVKGLITIIIIIVATLLGINIDNIFPDETTQGGGTETTIGGQTNDQDKEIEGELMVHMIDVGQADGFLLVQNGETALIDCGTRTTGKDVVEYLKKLGITKLDYVIGTHPHDDHMGGMYDVITNFEVGKIIIPEVEAGKVTTNWYIKLMQEIKDKKHKVEYPEVGKIYSLGEATMKIIAAMEDPGNNLNNYSIVFKVSFGEMDIIMTGDAETEVEAEILKSGEAIEAEILKMGHHGSDTSTSNEFLEAVNPDYALISSKVGNKYEHPIKSTMDKLKKSKITVYRTDENGTVVATITANEVKFNCKPGDYISGQELAEREGQ